MRSRRWKACCSASCFRAGWWWTGSARSRSAAGATGPATGSRALVERIQEMGCVIKDLDIGLVDFPTLFRGEEVYLCWKMDEPGIGFWHGVHEGFAGRKPIDQDFLEHHQGDLAQ